ncbi:MAG TPA: PqqD family protein [Phycisphaerae bacterium]|nr:PqqD family protein [Phycisphaerae bacterium]HRR85866.1 PqqD family protein [Phycisphaerae bacterium]
MGWRRKKTPGLSREMLLAARPLRNPNITEKEIAGGGLELTVSLPRSRLFRWLSGGCNHPIVRRYQLDVIGVETWRMIDGRTTIMTMIERLGSAHGMEPRQAEAAMLAYLRTLAQRGIMMLALPHEEPRAADKDRLHTS